MSLCSDCPPVGYPTDATRCLQCPRLPQRHDAGGKGRMRLLPGVTGLATFSGDRDEHRLTLERRAPGCLEGAPFALWCGMNPSTAEADEDDLTVRKEQEWTRRLGLLRYIKVNFGSYRCTDPKGLSVAGVMISHPQNLICITDLASRAEKIVMACGDPPEVLMPHARTVLRMMKTMCHPMWCLGTTKAGWPKHSSRLGYETPMVEFRP